MTAIDGRNPAPFAFGTKAETLHRLGPHLRKFLVPASYHFTIAQWREDPDRVLRELGQNFPGGTIIVRSSAHGEDGAEHSMAGQVVAIACVKKLACRLVASIADVREILQHLMSSQVRPIVVLGLNIEYSNQIDRAVG